MRNSLIINKKGFTAIAFAFLTVISVSLAIALFLSLYGYYLSLTEGQRAVDQSNYYAEFGIERALWLINLDAWKSTETLTIPSSGNLTVKIDVVRNALGSYTITSTVGNKKITASYKNGKVSSWNY